MAQRKYDKLVTQLTPDMAAYEQQRRQFDNVAFAGMDAVHFDPLSKPSKEALDRLAKDVKRQYVACMCTTTHGCDALARARTEQRGKSSKRRAPKEDEDITYINDRNQHYNRKIARAFDAYTKETRDAFERGTAL